MSQEIDRSAATKLLNESLNRCSNKPVSSCLIKDTIDFVLAGNYCLTYRYIMFTALVAKAVNPAIDVLSLQAQDILLQWPSRSSRPGMRRKDICHSVPFPS